MYTRAVVARGLRHPRFRGGVRDDGRVTLLTVNYNSDEDVHRLLMSSRRFIDGSMSARPVVVANTRTHDAVAAHARVVGLGTNLHHGLGLDFGLFFVRTEYTLICDPDSIILSERFWPEMRQRVDTHGAASIDIGSIHYHPICLAFRTETWKHNSFYMREDWANGCDVGGHLTHYVGGLRDEALLVRTRRAGPAIRSSRPGKHHYLGEVYEEVFSNTVGGSRAMTGPAAFGPEEGSYAYITDYQQRWRLWADRYVERLCGLEEFPTS